MMRRYFSDISRQTGSSSEGVMQRTKRELSGVELPAVKQDDAGGMMPASPTGSMRSFADLGGNSSLKKLPFFSHSDPQPRVIPLTGRAHNMHQFPANVICNQKYSLLTFIPKTLYEQFKYFINLYYLLISLSQLIPALKVGFLFTYIAPLVFVVALSMLKEAYDDLKRRNRDRAVNSEVYSLVTPNGLVDVTAAELCVGHLIQVKANQRIPADLILLRTTSETGASFIRTDQLDGETDWKLRRAVTLTQELESDQDLFQMNGQVYADRPITDIYKFIGTFTEYKGSDEQVEPLNLEQTLWSSTVLASDTVIGLVAYTGTETRSVINTRQPSNKIGKLDQEVNFLTVMLCVLQFVLTLLLTLLSEFRGIWWLNFFRYVILICGIIPISMRVNLDFAKLVYAYSVMKDSSIPGCIVRNTNIPEDCGRISYLLSDKTGTLTQNDMIFKKLHMGLCNFSSESLSAIEEHLETFYNGSGTPLKKSSAIIRMADHSLVKQVHDMICAAALCHNVTLSTEEDENTGTKVTSYQAASPDEVALVKFSESVGMKLHDRTLRTISLMNPQEEIETYEILECFPFTSARKRMGIILRNEQTGVIRFLMKGADVVMKEIVEDNDWLDEECNNLARDGLRTLVFGQRTLSESEYEEFSARLKEAQSSIEDREENVDRVVDSLEENLLLLGLTGVEDKLQLSVRETLEVLRCAGIKIWMLTGDKRETATCISISSKLVARHQSIYQLEADTVEETSDALKDFALLTDAVLVIDGGTLALCLDDEAMEQLFFESTRGAPAVVCCRCSPTQKAQVVELIRSRTDERVAAIGDGGNDVSMIQAAHLGIGIEGKEGKQAALAADYSTQQFSHIAKLFLWHGRNAYHRSASISQIIAYRGMIFAFLQVLYCTVFYAAPVTLYTGMLVFGYSCWYTMLPIFALVTDRDCSPEDALMFPELYHEVRKGHAFSAKTFSLWSLVSVVQTAVIFFLGLVLLHPPVNTVDFVAVTFTALNYVVLANVVIIVKSWNVLIAVSVVVTAAIYPPLMILLPSYYNIQYISSWAFWWKTSLVVFVATMPVFLVKRAVDIFSPRTTLQIS